MDDTKRLSINYTPHDLSSETYTPLLLDAWWDSEIRIRECIRVPRRQSFGMRASSLAGLTQLTQSKNVADAKKVDPTTATTTSASTNTENLDDASMVV